MTLSPFRIEPMRDEHLAECWQLRLRALRDHPDAFGQPYEEAARLSQDEIRKAFDSFWNFEDNQVFLALAGSGEIVGMTGVARMYRKKMRHRTDIWGVYVAPEYRGNGLSTALLGAAIDYCRNLEGVLQVELQVVSNNHAAVRSYERAGFVRWGRMPRADIADGVALDNDFMVLMLDDGNEPAHQPTEGTTE